MDLQQLQSALQEERASDRLQSLPETFYSDVESHISTLRADREMEAENVPNIFDSREVMTLSHKIQRAEETLEKIYNRRVGKIINQAVLAASGGNFNKEPLTELETDLYNSIIEDVNENRDACLSVLSDSADTSSMFSSKRDSTDTVSSLTTDTNADDNDQTTADSDNISEYMGDNPDDADAQPDSDTETSPNSTGQSGGFAADVEFGNDSNTTDSDDSHDKTATTDDSTEDQSDSSDDFTEQLKSTGKDATQERTANANEADGEGTNADSQIPRVTVQVTEDVGELFGVDNRTYNLEEEDVVSLPQENAEPLIKQDAATSLD